MNTTTNQGLDWLSRTIAILLVMVGPALLGGYFDRQLGTRFLMPTALVLGMSLGMFLLLLLAKQLIPPAGGFPLPIAEEEEEEDQDQDQYERAED